MIVKERSSEKSFVAAGLEVLDDRREPSPWLLKKLKFLSLAVGAGASRQVKQNQEGWDGERMGVRYSLGVVTP